MSFIMQSEKKGLTRWENLFLNESKVALAPIDTIKSARKTSTMRSASSGLSMIAIGLNLPPHIV
jgi:hypothetical protein